DRVGGGYLAVATRPPVLREDPEVVARDPTLGPEAHASGGSLFLPVPPEGRLPLTEVCDVHDHQSGEPAHREQDLGCEVSVDRAAGQTRGEGDLAVILNVEEVGGAQLRVQVGLSGVELRGVDFTETAAGARG